MPTLQTGEREQLLHRFEAATRKAKPRTSRFFLSYAAVPILEELASLIEIRFGADAVLWDKKIPLGAKITTWLERALDDTDVIIVAVGSSWGPSSGSFREVERALRDVQAIKVSRETVKSDLQRLVDQLALVGTAISQDSVEVDVDDPHKGQFGGEAARAGRLLSARVSPTPTSEWFLIELLVESVDSTPLEGDVEFHLHPSFNPSVVRVPVQKGRATCRTSGWGAFTAGAVADNGLTRLELNLADLPDAPPVFRDR